MSTKAKNGLQALLTPEESLIDERTRALRFDIALIGSRMSGAVDRVAEAPATRHLAIGLFGASTGAAAALIAAAARGRAGFEAVARGRRLDRSCARISGRAGAEIGRIAARSDTDRRRIEMAGITVMSPVALNRVEGRAVTSRLASLDGVVVSGISQNSTIKDVVVRAVGQRSGLPSTEAITGTDGPKLPQTPGWARSST